MLKIHRYEGPPLPGTYSFMVVSRSAVTRAGTWPAPMVTVNMAGEMDGFLIGETDPRQTWKLPFVYRSVVPEASPPLTSAPPGTMALTR
jgi:hypothetical protein